MAYKDATHLEISPLPWAPPALEGHYTVMEDVEEGEVAELLGQHKEDAIKHVNELGKTPILSHNCIIV